MAPFKSSNLLMKGTLTGGNLGSFSSLEAAPPSSLGIFFHPALLGARSNVLFLNPLKPAFRLS